MRRASGDRLLLLVLLTFLMVLLTCSVLYSHLWLGITQQPRTAPAFNAGDIGASPPGTLDFEPGTLKESKATVFRQCQLPRRDRGFTLKSCGLAENQQWLWITTPKAGSSTAREIWRKSLNIVPVTRIDNMLCDLLAADYNGTHGGIVQNSRDVDIKDLQKYHRYNHSAIKFAFVREPLDKLLSAVEEIMTAIMTALVEGNPEWTRLRKDQNGNTFWEKRRTFVTKDQLSQLKLARIWDRTAEVGFTLLRRLGWGSEMRGELPGGGDLLHLWRRVSSEKEYKQLVSANLQDYLHRLEDPQFDPNFEVHFVPQTEWFSENGVPHYHLEALVDLAQWSVADKVRQPS